MLFADRHEPVLDVLGGLAQNDVYMQQEQPDEEEAKEEEAAKEEVVAANPNAWIESK